MLLGVIISQHSRVCDGKFSIVTFYFLLFLLNPSPIPLSYACNGEKNSLHHHIHLPPSSPSCHSPSPYRMRVVRDFLHVQKNLNVLFSLFCHADLSSSPFLFFIPLLILTLSTSLISVSLLASLVHPILISSSLLFAWNNFSHVKNFSHGERSPIFLPPLSPCHLFVSTSSPSLHLTPFLYPFIFFPSIPLVTTWDLPCLHLSHVSYIVRERI